MNNVSLPPSPGAQLDNIWKGFQSAVGDFAARIEELHAAEQAVAPCQDYMAIMSSGNLPNFDAISLKVAREIRDSLVAKASRCFAPDGASLEINTHELDERFPLDSNTGVADFNAVAIWDFLVSRYSGDGGKEIAWQQAASSLMSSFGLHDGAEVKTKGGRVVLELSVYSEKHFRGHWEISYRSGESVSAAFSNLVAFARWADLDEFGDECDSAARQWSGFKSAVTSRAKYLLATGCEYVTFLSSFEFRFAPRVAEQLQIFIATFGGNKE